MKRSLKIGLAIAGAIIGAGFATGKELLIFFSGNSVFYVVLLALSIMLMGTASLFHFYSVKKRKDSKLFKAIFLTFSGGCYAIMLACGGQTIHEMGSSINLGLNSGIFITYIITIVVISFGIEGVYKFNTFATPIIILSLIFISFAGLSTPVFNNFSSPYMNSALYSGYNILAVLPFISAISKETDERDGSYGIITGFFLVLITSIAVKLLLNNYFSLISSESLPLLKIVGILSPYFSYIYSVVLYISIATTAVNSLYALADRKNLKTIFLISLPCLLLSFFGFVTLLEKIYTYFGYVGIAIIFIITIRRICHGK